MKRIILIFSLIFAVEACKEEPTLTISGDVGEITLEAAASSEAISIITNNDWSAKSSASWLSISPASGSSGRTRMEISAEENTATEDRTAELNIFSESLFKSVKVKQLAASEVKPPVVNPPVVNPPVGDEIKADVPGLWMELPATDNDELYFISHKSKNSRNYSYYYDVDALQAHWVAYPLNEGLIGSGKRTDEWGFDPKIPSKYQQVLNKGYAKDSNGKTVYDRGHQLPSADRLNYADNVTTFYFTNMTPQLQGLNQRAWEGLEGKVRDWAEQMDTLYVVTGAYLEGSKTYTQDNIGQDIPVPVGYYKALLGYKKNASIGSKTGGYIGTAFYFKHEAGSDYMSKMISIDELEEKVGIDFFVNLPAATGADIASKVESSIDSWWK